jgi:hypothetical protein
MDAIEAAFSRAPRVHPGCQSDHGDQRLSERGRDSGSKKQPGSFIKVNIFVKMNVSSTKPVLLKSTILNYVTYPFVMKLFTTLTPASKHHLFLANLVLSVLFGFIVYWMLYGRFHLYFTHVNWIYSAGGDVLQHQLGWEWFRQEPWQFPIGKIVSYGYPFGTSLTYMDSIPLFAVPFKLISPWFKPNFQYFGIWELSAVIGQMLAGMLIFNEFTRSYLLKITGASLLTLSPPMIFRAFYHSSLSAHWILLVAILFVLLEHRHKLWRGAWIILFGSAVLIHIYYVPMLVPLWLIALFFRYEKEEKSFSRNLNLLIDTASIALVVLFVGYGIGLFSLSYQSLSVYGYGLFSWNLNGFFNPFDYSSRFIQARDTGFPQQFEGFSYLGLGNLIILPVSLYLLLERDYLRRYAAFLIPFVAASLLYILFALSNKAFLDTQSLWDFQLPDSIITFINLFRVSGRFIWPVFYLLVIFGILMIIRHVRYPVPVLILVLLLQFIDIQPLYHSKRLPGVISYQTALQAEFWKSAAATNSNIVVIPKEKLTQEEEPIALYAVRNNLTLNLGYFARSDRLAFKEYGDMVWEDLKANKVDSKTIYIITDLGWIEYVYVNLTDQMFICDVDGHTVLFSTENELVYTGADLFSICSVPVQLSW